MKQVLQSLKTGETELADVPCPQIRPGHLLIRTRATLVSAGTEKMLVDFGRASLLAKARQQPDKVRMVLDKIKTDGFAPTVEAVRSKLDQPLPLGYCNAGVVTNVGDGVTGFSVGDRVASNGPHAETVSVPKNLCAKIPDGVPFEHAAFTVAGAIGLQGLRLVQPTLGETVVVSGLGLIGLLCVQMLQAAGCRVLGIDPDTSKCEAARALGAETVDLSANADPVAAGMAFSGGHGVDAVVITAATTSSEPVHQAANMSRRRGRIVLVGVTGLELSRADFYEKELTFQVSCSYGPGRYDPQYEERGHDYPLGFVRWTEQRNFGAVLDLMASGRLDVEPMISHRFSIDEATTAYDLLGTGAEPYLAIVLTYPAGDERDRATARSTTPLTGVDRPVSETDRSVATSVVAGVIGSGNFTGRVMLPALKKTGVRLKTLASAGGVSSTVLGRKFGFESSTTDAGEVLGSEEINVVFVTTPHDTHGRLVIEALGGGKHVFVEKPLCITRTELDEIVPATTSERDPLVMIGFNRRFAPHVIKMKQLADSVQDAKNLIMTVNAGMIPADHWTQDRDVGGGRIIGEGCHFIDLLRFLVGHPITGVQAAALGASTVDSVTEDKVSFTLTFADGSVGTVHYLANGHKSFPKERLELFCAGRILQLDNFRRLRGFGWPGFRKMNLWRQDKGHAACVTAFIDSVKTGGVSPIPMDEILEVTRVSLDIADQVR